MSSAITSQPLLQYTKDLFCNFITHSIDGNFHSMQQICLHFMLQYTKNMLFNFITASIDGELPCTQQICLHFMLLLQSWERRSSLKYCYCSIDSSSYNFLHYFSLTFFVTSCTMLSRRNWSALVVKPTMMEAHLLILYTSAIWNVKALLSYLVLRFPHDSYQ